MTPNRLMAMAVAILLGCDPTVTIGYPDGGAIGGGFAGGGFAGGGFGGGGFGGGGFGGGGGWGGGGWGGGGGSYGLAQWCADVFPASLGVQVRCGAATQAYAEAIRSLFAQTCQQSWPHGGRIELRQAEVEVCLSRLSSLSCLQDTTNGVWAQPGCGPDLFHGLVGLDGDCRGLLGLRGIECQDPYYCDTSATCPGKCLNRAAVGQTPRGEQECVKSAYLYGGTCTLYVAPGQSCAPMRGVTSPQTCAPPYTCSPAEVCATIPLLKGLNESCGTSRCGLGLSCVNGTCQALVDLNGACDNLRACKGGLRCSTANVCVPSIPRGAGSSCSLDSSGCLPEFFCNTPAGITEGTCAARRPLNGTCTYPGHECATDLHCTATLSMRTGTCQLPGSLNEACTNDGSFSQCAKGLYCTATSSTSSGLCAKEKGEGASCQQPQECASHSCTNGACERPECWLNSP